MNQIKARKLSPKLVTLLFIENPRVFNAAQGLDGQLVGPYRIVLQMPIGEFFTTTPMELAVELVQHTAGAPWAAARMRKIAPGDLFCHGAAPYMFIAQRDIPYYPPAVVYRSDKWADGAIVQLHPDTVDQLE